MLENISITLPEAQVALHDDVTKRVAAIEVNISKLPIRDNIPNLDEGLKLADFSDEHPTGKFNEKLRELNYIIGRADGSTVTHRKYRAVEAGARRRTQNVFRNFKPDCSMELLQRIKSSTKLETTTDEPTLLSTYYELDSKLSRFEKSIEQISNAFDVALQNEIDLRRGK